MTLESTLKDALPERSRHSPSRNGMPRVSVGMPVYNGEKYVGEAIESILGQSFREFELIVADNASTDRTQAICEGYAAVDPRIRYLRSPTNLGAPANYTRVVAEASGEYFKWAAHDDVCHPEFLATCVEALDADPGLVAAYPQTVTVDHEGKPIKVWPLRPSLGAHEPRTRLREALAWQEVHLLWGVIRLDALRRTALLGPYWLHEQPFLAEVCLLGRIHEVPRPLFYNRDHPSRSSRAYNWRDPSISIIWYDPSKKGKLIFPYWRLLREYLGAIRRAPLGSAEKLSCLRELVGWMRWQAPGLRGDLARAASRTPLIGPLFQKCAGRMSLLAENRRWRKVASRVSKVTGPPDLLALADDCWMGWEHLMGRRYVPFLEKDGHYNGPPPDDEIGIRELERMRATGVTHLVFANQAMWWLEHYSGMKDHLGRRYRCTARDAHLAVYDLREPLLEGTPRPPPDPTGHNENPRS